jgi:hypothetical protein
MTFEDEVRARLAKIEADSRYKAEDVNVEVNAPLALIQMGLKGQAEVLNWVLKRLHPEISLPDQTDHAAYTVVGKHIVFVHAAQDESPDNPCDWDGMGKIHSFSRKHSSYLREFDFPASKEECEVQLRKRFGKDIVILGYFEHGACDWHISGHMPAGTECDYRWDGVSFAGVWVPSKDIVRHANGKHMKGDGRQTYMIEQAAHCCKTYTMWCNGEVYGYTLKAYTAKYADDGAVYDQEDDYRHEQEAHEDSCWGYYGWDDLRTAMKDAAETCRKKLLEAAA